MPIESEKTATPPRTPKAGDAAIQASLWRRHVGAWPPWLLGLILAAVVALLYSNTLHGPFLFDDFLDIRDNPTIRHLWPLQDVFFLPGNGLRTRPVVNLTFAINYAMGGLDPFWYHLTNLLIHVGATLALFGALRRAFLLPSLKDRFGSQAMALSVVIAGLWGVHPLLTEAISYTVQRYESLMAMLVLLTFYCVLRTADSPAPGKWMGLASLSCLLALGSKEVAVSVPLLVLLFDRTFMAGSFREALRRRRVLYVGLLVAWGCFALLQVHPVHRSFAGGEVGLPWWKYALNQSNVILHYLRLSVWPRPLVFDYFWPVAKTWTQLVPGICAIGSLLGLTAWGLVRKPALAFLPTCFFFILAPTSSVMPILDLAVEHRMYLPLVPVVIVLVLVGHCLLGKLEAGLGQGSRLPRLAGLVLVAGSLSAMGVATYLRNEDFQDPLDIWRAAVLKAPNNPRAHHNYAFCLAEEGRYDEAVRHYETAVTQVPGVALFESNYGVLLGKMGRYEDSLKHLRLAVQLEPGNYKHVINLGVTLWQKGSVDNAMICFGKAVELNPRSGLPYAAMASIQLDRKNLQDADALIRRAISLEPYDPAAHFIRGIIRLELKDTLGARAAFQDAIRVDANREKMATNVGWAYHMRGLDREAVAALREALGMRPGYLQGEVRLAKILATSPDDSVRNGAEALAITTRILGTQPSFSPELLDLLAVSLAETNRFPEACAVLEKALAQSRDRQESWVPDLEKRLALFRKGQPYREMQQP